MKYKKPTWNTLPCCLLSPVLSSLVFEGCCLGKHLELSSWLKYWCFLLLWIYERIINFSFLPSGACVPCSIFPIPAAFFLLVPTLTFVTGFYLFVSCCCFVHPSSFLCVSSHSPSFTGDASLSMHPLIQLPICSFILPLWSSSFCLFPLPALYFPSVDWHTQRPYQEGR